MTGCRLSDEVLRTLVDPLTKKPLTAAEVDQRCRNESFHEFLPSDRDMERVVGRRTFSLWKQVQAAGEESYQADGPVGNFSHDNYHPSIVLGQELRRGKGGLFLDVGCGLLGKPVYMKETEGHCRFVGIDPVATGDRALYQPREFDFLQAVGDFLPFRGGSFDGVVFSSTLDHHLKPDLALAEAYRVLKPGGELYVVETIRRVNKVYIKWLIKLIIFGSARFNRFHCWAFTRRTIRKKIENTGFEIKAAYDILLPQHFIKAVKS